MTTDDRLTQALGHLEAYIHENDLGPETEATLQEAIELLRGLGAHSDSLRPTDAESNSLAATFGSEAALPGRFAPDDVVLFTPGPVETEWIAAAADAVLSLDEHR